MIISFNILNENFNFSRIIVKSKKMHLGISFMQILSDLKSPEIDDL